MNRKRIMGKVCAVLLVLILLFLVCSGCGSRERLQEKQTAEDCAGCDDSIARTAAPSEENETTVLAVAPLLEWQDPDTENLAGLLQENCGGMMVQLTAGQYMGSGVICGEEEDCIVIVTAAHVLADAAGGVQVTFVDSRTVDAEDYSISEKTDLAVVRVPMKEISEAGLEKYLAANLDKPSYEQLQAQDGCIVMGCKSGVAEEAYEGIVLDPWIYMEDYGQHMIWVSAYGMSGMSGGGLFDRRGHLLGILSGRSEDDEWAVIPLALVLEIL